MGCALRGADLLNYMTYKGKNMKLSKKHFDRQPDKKVESKKVDAMAELKKAYSKPQKVAKVGGKGYV